MSAESQHVSQLTCLALREADLKSRPYEFLNTADSEEMTVNISVPADTQMKAASHAQRMFRLCVVVVFICTGNLEIRLPRLLPQARISL